MRAVRCVLCAGPLARVRYIRTLEGALPHAVADAPQDVRELLGKKLSIGGTPIQQNTNLG